LKLVIVLLDFPGAFVKKNYNTTDTRLFEILVTEIPDRNFTLGENLGE
jgi:hypothetical protein